MVKTTRNDLEMFNNFKSMGKRFGKWYMASETPTMVTCTGVIVLILAYDWLSKHALL